MQGMSSSDLGDRPYSFPSHPCATQKVVLGYLSGGNGQTGVFPEATGTYAGRELCHRMADDTQNQERYGGTGYTIHAGSMDRNG